MSEAFDGLDLTGTDPDAIGFPAVPSGLYPAHVGKANWDNTDNPEGKLPVGTPYLNLGIRVNDDVEDRDGMKVAGVYCGWTKLFIPPADYDPTKASNMKNRMANFLKAIGEDYTKKGYKIPDADDLVGKELVAVVRKKPDKRQSSGFSNEIEGFKVAGSEVGAEATAGLR